MRLDGDKNPAITLGLEFNFAFGHSKDRVICADADVGAWVPLRAALTAQNVSWDDVFAAVALNAEAFRF